MPPPTLTEFSTFAKSKGIDTGQAAMLFERWSGADWIDGHNKPIKNWKLRLITWKQNGWLPQPVANNGQQKNRPETQEEKEARWAQEEAYGHEDTPFMTNGVKTTTSENEKR